MNTMLSDDDVTRLLGEAAGSFAVPAEGPSFARPERTRTPRRRRVVRLTAVAAAVVAGVIAVQASGGGNDLLKRTDVAGSPASSEAGLSGGGTTGGTSGTSGAGSSADSTYQSFSPNGALTDQKSVRTTAGSTKTLTSLSGAAASGSGSLAAAPPPTIAQAGPGDAFEDGARIVKTGTIGLVVSDGKVSGVVGRVRGIAVTVRGYVADEKSQEFGDDPSSTLTLRVPVSTFERTVQAVRDTVKGGVGKVDTSTTSGQDVTGQYADLQAQIQSLTAARNRFLTILSRANTIGETLSVQQRVDSTQLQIDRLEGQRRALAKQSDLATLTVTVSEKAKSEAKIHVQGGLSRSWDDAKHGFTSGVESLIAHSGRALLVLILAVVGLFVLRSGYRVARRRMV